MAADPPSPRAEECDTNIGALHPRAGEDGAGDTLGDTIASTEQGFGLAEDRATLAQLLRTLTPREREVLRLRFEDGLTQRQIGRRIGVSQMQTSRIIRHAIARMDTAAQPPGSAWR